MSIIGEHPWPLVPLHVFFVTCSCKCCNNFTDCDILKNFVYMSNYVLCTIAIIFYVKVQGLKKKLR